MGTPNIVNFAADSNPDSGGLNDLLFRTLWNSSQDNLFLISIGEQQHTFIQANPGFLRTLRIKEGAITGHPLQSVLSEAATQAMELRIAQCLAAGKAISFEEEIDTHDGGHHHWHTQLIPFRRDNTSLILGVSRNINELCRIREDLEQAKEEAEAANRAKSSFLATMSHEMRTPLFGIIATCDLMQSNNLPPENRYEEEEEAEIREQRNDHLRLVRKSAVTLDRLTRDILDFSTLKAGALEIVSEPFEVIPFLEDLHTSMAPMAEAKGLTLEYRCPKPYNLMGDANRLRQILVNLLGNALKFTSDGGISIAIEEVEHSGSQITLAISVADSGIGFNMNRVRELFQPFGQVDSSATRAFGGAGLGLAISAELARRMGGSIDAISHPGQGSTFRVTLPFTEATNLRHNTPQTSAFIQSPIPSGLKILVAEDNPSNQIVLRELLVERGFEVTLVPNGQEAVIATKHDTYDVILMDWHMPIMDGLEAAQAIRKGERNTHVPIIALTANAMEDGRLRCLAAGMDDFLTKPVSGSQLVSTIARWVDEDLDD